MRDTRADLEYFDRGIDDLDKVIASITESLASVAHGDIASQFHELDELVTILVNRLSAAYSRGDSLDELRARLSDLVDVAARVEALKPQADSIDYRSRDELVDYRMMLWVVSLGVAMGMPEEEFAAIVRATSALHGDRLIDSLIASRIAEHPIGEALLFPRVVGSLTQVFDEDPSTTVVASYLKSWDKQWKKDTLLIGTDALIGPTSYGYYGYWSFEALGVVAALGLDDQPLRSFSNYPADLLHASDVSKDA